jgi:FAD/FMN-containing dehydrogenase
VTVDLNRLSDVEILEGDTKARVGGGATSIQVYEALESRNLSFVGGRVGSVGMGGFTLGGGTSPFSNKYGWSLDNVYEYEVRSTSGQPSIIQPLISSSGCTLERNDHDGFGNAQF